MFCCLNPLWPCHSSAISRKICLESSITWSFPSSSLFSSIPHPHLTFIPHCTSHGKKTCISWTVTNMTKHVLLMQSLCLEYASFLCLSRKCDSSFKTQLIHHLLYGASRDTQSPSLLCKLSPFSIGSHSSGADISISSTIFHYAVYSITWQCMWVIEGSQ